MSDFKPHPMARQGRPLRDEPVLKLLREGVPARTVALRMGVAWGKVEYVRASAGILTIEPYGTANLYVPALLAQKAVVKTPRIFDYAVDLINLLHDGKESVSSLFLKDRWQLRNIDHVISVVRNVGFAVKRKSWCNDGFTFQTEYNHPVASTEKEEPPVQEPAGPAATEERKDDPFDKLSDEVLELVTRVVKLEKMLEETKAANEEIPPEDCHIFNLGGWNIHIPHSLKREDGLCLARMIYAMYDDEVE